MCSSDLILKGYSLSLPPPVSHVSSQLLAYNLIVRSEPLHYELPQTHAPSSLQIYLHRCPTYLLYPVWRERVGLFSPQNDHSSSNPILDLPISPALNSVSSPSTAPFLSVYKRAEVLSIFRGGFFIASLSGNLYLYPLFLLPQLLFTHQLTESSFSSQHCT